MINPKTGLKETDHDFYGVPLVHQRGISTLKLTGQPTAVHKVPLGNGVTLDFYSTLRKSSELFVVFPGANTSKNHFYPRFERVYSMQPRVKSFMAFADPTIQFGLEQNMWLSWFLGGPGFDPMPVMFRAIQKALGRTGASHVAFIGGSGGGYAALRASAAWPGSLAFIQDPQTVIANYVPSVVDKYFDTMWSGWDSQKLMEAFPERFNMVEHYRTLQPRNFVYYAQSSSDKQHVAKHFAPFAEAHGMEPVAGTNRVGNRRLALYEGEVPGHAKITGDEYGAHLAAAIQFWRESR